MAFIDPVMQVYGPKNPFNHDAGLEDAFWSASSTRQGSVLRADQAFAAGTLKATSP